MVKLWDGIPLAAHAPERIVVTMFAWWPTKTSKGEIVWLERLRYTLEREWDYSRYSHYWSASQIDRIDRKTQNET